MEEHQEERVIILHLDCTLTYGQKDSPWCQTNNTETNVHTQRFQQLDSDVMVVAMAMMNSTTRVMISGAARVMRRSVSNG